jgi:alpha-beta hydrolase superfamily lysophospholipase
MGAATALLYAAADKGATVVAMVLDSPFVELTQLFCELAQSPSGRRVPGCLVRMALSMIEPRLKQAAGVRPSPCPPPPAFTYTC